MAVVNLADVAVMVEIGSPAIVVNAAKYVVTVRAKAVPMAQALVRYAP